ncbi:hypothetical protein VC83_08944 [Pseudogymnoascus destructans]|nr:uncharacterized protein VC83_08944 [Pseudogymnoascus destructans]OAF54704.2 hypothetical protein VC83_08944 [Pseudogymnoascus destructans]
MDVSGSPDESADDILYERTRNTTASSRPTKTIASGIPPLERKHPGRGFAVDEFRGVEDTVSGSRRRRRPDGQRSSTQSSPEATIMDGDEIQYSELEFAKPPEPYRGTAKLFPSRAEKERYIRNSEQRRLAEPRSGHFIEPSTKSNISVSKREAPIILDREKDSRQTRVRNLRIHDGGPRNSVESISDDELSMGKSGADLKKTTTRTVMSQFSGSPTSGSMSRAGDIRSSLPRQNQRKTLGRAGKPSSGERPRFLVTYMRSAPEIITPVKGEEPWYLQYNPMESRMDVMLGDLNLTEKRQHLSYTFDPTAVTKITYSPENFKAALWVTERNTMTGSLPKLLLEVDNEVFYDFVTFLQSKSQASAFEESGDKLERTFLNTGKSYEVFQRRKADDLNLLKQRRNQRHQASDAGLTGDGKRPGNFDSSEEPPRSKKLHERLQNGYSDNETSKPDGNSIETKRSIERSRELGDETQSRQFGRNGNDSDNRPTTRSTRGQNREIRISSPSPVRYTNIHRDWQTYWAGGDEPLIFPLGGMNKAQVDKRDIERLDEGEYLNDNLITFYLRYLQEKTEKERPDVFKRVFFMNTFFYPRLIQGKGRKNIDYDAVKRWTSKVNIFGYDYVVVPVNENNHWYVAIICNLRKLLLSPEEKISKGDEQVHEKEVVDLGDAGNTTSPAQLTSEHKEGSVPPEMARKVSRLSIDDRVSPEQPKGANHIDVERINPGTPSHISTADDDTDRPQKATSSASKGRKGKRKSIPPVRKYNTEEPRIITLDSFGVSHSPTCSNLRDFLIAEAKEKLGVEITLAQPSIGMTAKNIPQQDNFCDCGLFLLGYVEGFLDHPDETIHSIMQGRTDMASSFPKMNAPDMRNAMRQLIFKLRSEQTATEHAAKIAKIAAKKAGKAKEQPAGESKSVSSASMSPKPPAPPKLEAKAVEELASAIVTKVVPKPSEEVVVEEEQPNKESPPTSDEAATVDSFIDILAGYEADTEKDEKATEPSPPITAPPIEELPGTPCSATRDEASSPKTSSTKSKFFNVKTKGMQPKFPSKDRNRQRKDAGEVSVEVPPSTPPPRQPQQQKRSSPRNHIDIPSESSEDSLRINMSPSILGRKAAPKHKDEIPDSQGDDAKQGGGRGVDKGKVVEDLTETPRMRAGEAALKRQKDMVGVQKKKSGAGGVFGSPREKGRKKDPVVVDDEE